MGRWEQLFKFLHFYAQIYSSYVFYRLKSYLKRITSQTDVAYMFVNECLSHFQNNRRQNAARHRPKSEDVFLIIIHFIHYEKSTYDCLTKYGIIKALWHSKCNLLYGAIRVYDWHKEQWNMHIMEMRIAMEGLRSRLSKRNRAKRRKCEEPVVMLYYKLSNHS